MDGRVDNVVGTEDGGIFIFEIRTYILKRKVGRKDIVKEDFCLCKDYECLQYITDKQYINGMIEIIYFGKKILGENEWDLVDQLWVCFIEAFIQLKEREYVEFYFPDQPLKIRMTDKNGEYLILEVGNQKDCFPKRVFIQEMLEEAKHFFTILDYQCKFIFVG